MNIDWICFLKAVVSVLCSMAIGALIVAIGIAVIWGVGKASGRLGVDEATTHRGTAIVIASIAVIALCAMRYLINCP
jgi:hypothetical protein